MIHNSGISQAMTIQLEALFNELPDMPEFAPGIRRAPKREFTAIVSGRKAHCTGSRLMNIGAIAWKVKPFR